MNFRINSGSISNGPFAAENSLHEQEKESPCTGGGSFKWAQVQAKSRL